MNQDIKSSEKGIDSNDEMNRDMKVKRTNTVKKRSFFRNLWRHRVLIMMCMPAITFFIIFSYMPMPGAYIAFTNFNYNKGIFGSPFVGFQNFKFLFTSGQLWLLTKNTILYNVAFILCGNALQIFVAILINELVSTKFKKVSQTLMFLPYFISAVIVGLMTYNLFNYEFGFVNTLLEKLGREPVKFYSNPAFWPPIIVLVHLWQSTGYGSIVYFAAIMGIDKQTIEAARVDGANGFQKIFHIIIPSLKPTIIILLLFSMGGILRGNFGMFWNIIGANSLLFNTTDIIETYVYRSMLLNFNFTTASAVGLYQSLFGFALVMTVNWIVRKIDEDYALF